MKRMITLTVAAAAAAAAVLPAAASAATAPAPVRALTFLTHRGDSGGNGNWATDTGFRYEVITDHGPDSNVALGHDYTATVRDTGSFVTISRAFTPNQSGVFAGMKITGAAVGSWSGGAAYSFTATKAPVQGLTPAFESGTPSGGPQTTSLWFEQAFPAGTSFTGGISNTWSWSYTGPACFTVSGHRVKVTRQSWTDAASNNGGQTAGAGEITGVCR